MTKPSFFILIGLFLFKANNSIAQNLIFDRGEGESKAIRVGYTIIKLIEEKNLVEVFKFYKDHTSSNKKELEGYIETIGLLNPKRGTLPQSFYEESDDGETYYERNYCLKSGAEIKYILQLHVNLVRNSDQYLIENIEFRKGNDIQKRDKEIEQMDNVEHGGPPGPPPPPPIR